MPAVDLISRVRRLIAIPGSALAELLSDGASTWGPHEENTARLLETRAFELGLTWADRTIDQDDPAVKRERAEARRAGIKPPPEPLIPPVALRPRAIAEKRIQEYLDEVGKYHTATQPKTQLMTSSEYDKAKGIVAERI